jgi:hypothetical protein
MACRTPPTAPVTDPPPTATRRRLLASACAALAAPALLPRPAGAISLPHWRLATSTPGGGFALYGETLVRLVNDRSTLMTAVPTSGTAENLALLQAHKVHAALVQGTVASEVLARPDADGLRIFFAMYPSPGLLAVPAASPLQRLHDVRGQRVVFGVRSSGLVTLARQVFGSLAIDIDRDCEAVYVEQAAQAPRLVLAGEAAALWGAGEGWPGFMALAQAPGGARFIAPDVLQIDSIRRLHPHLQAMQVAAGAYPGITEPLPTVGSVNFILVHKDQELMPVRFYAAVMKRIGPALAAALPQAAFSTLENTRASAPSPALLHPGVR